MNRIQKILERRRKELAPPVIEHNVVRASLPRELPAPIAQWTTAERIKNTPK